MAELVAWVVAATAVEVAGLLGVVHAVLRRTMAERGMAGWRVADTLLTSPLLWLGAVLVCASLNRAVAAAALRAGRGGGEASSSVALALAAAAVGAAMMWFGVRAVGKLY